MCFYIFSTKPSHPLELKVLKISIIFTRCYDNKTTTFSLAPVGLSSSYFLQNKTMTKYVAFTTHKFTQLIGPFKRIVLTKSQK